MLVQLNQVVVARTLIACSIATALITLVACGKSWDRFDTPKYCARVSDLYRSGDCTGVAGATTACGGTWDRVVPPSCNDAIASTSCADLVNQTSSFWKACDPSNGCKAQGESDYVARVCSGGAVATDCATSESFDCRKLCQDQGESFNEDCDDSCGCCGADPPTGSSGPLGYEMRDPVTALCCCN